LQTEFNVYLKSNFHVLILKLNVLTVLQAV